MLVVDDVGEVVPGREHQAFGREHDAQRVAVADLGKRRDQLAHVLAGQGVPLPGCSW
jgi:hypothetical protein